MTRAARTFLETSVGMGAVAALALILAGCGTARVQQEASYRGALPRPSEIVVRPFAASPEEVKVHMGLGDHLAGRASYSARTAKEVEVGRTLARVTAEELAKKIDAMGLPARVAYEAPAGRSALVIDGALVSVDEGNRTQREVIGLGAGRSQLNLAARVYEYMPEGRRRVDAFEVDATGG